MTTEKCSCGIDKQTRLYQPETEKCSCGRGNTPPHCKHCGSFFNYGRKKFSKIVHIPSSVQGDSVQGDSVQGDVTVSTSLRDVPSGVDILVRNFYCRKCTSEFFEDEVCNAPELIHIPTREENQRNRIKLRDGRREGPLRGFPEGADFVEGLGVIPFLIDQVRRYPDNQIYKDKLAAARASGAPPLRGPLGEGPLRAPLGEPLRAPLGESSPRSGGALREAAPIAKSENPSDEDLRIEAGVSEEDWVLFKQKGGGTK